MLSIEASRQLLALKYLPPCDGPKLHAFKHRNAPIKWMEPLSSPEPGCQSYVFKVKIRSQTYALKVFKFSLPSTATSLLGPIRGAGVKEEDMAFHTDPFYAECRAYGRMQAAYTRRPKKPHFAECYGFLALNEADKDYLIDQGIDLYDEFRSDNEYMEIVKGSPVRALVKEYIEGSSSLDEKTAERIRRGIVFMNKKGILIRDVKLDNYVGDNTPQHLLDEWEGTDKVMFDDMLEEEGIKPKVPGLPVKAAPTQQFEVRPFQINLSNRVPHMLELIQGTQLPLYELAAARESMNDTLSTGISLKTLEDLKQQWITGFKWDDEQAAINKYTESSMHFVHERSGSPNAIPIILLHGWPGTFLEMAPLIELLVPKFQQSGKTVNTTFDVVIPSLPGFGFSSPPPSKAWDAHDSARVFNKLMTQVLGYQRYAVHGTDWGSDVGYSMYDQFNTTVRALHLNFLPFGPPTPADIAARNITLSTGELVSEQRNVDWEAAGNGYFIEQTTKPNTIGLALYDNPIGQLAWIGEKFIIWSDPRQGTGPSLLTHHEILREVSLYYLTRSFVSSVYIYAQNPGGFKQTDYSDVKARTDAPLLYTTFKYNIGFWPKEYVAAVGNLVSYKFQDFGGHFPGLDNPAGLADNIRDIGKYWV
ncbi:hypothetical protein ONZ43_g4309 [Nemania bipapillata]|uniref:Uncharacterized protein n=1 Tax=Nemania bipapillata TaxID=110536 RepID=A0ACC2IPD9_9PEZI|nr:hypothetical protein ONZ43_g4309 [Nemania bipapillata]